MTHGPFAAATFGLRCPLMTRRTLILFVAACLTAVGCGASGSDSSAEGEAPTPTEADGPAADPSPAEPVETEPEKAKPATPAAVDASPYVRPFGDVSAVAFPDGEPDEVSMVWSAETVSDSGSVPMVLRNNTSEDISRITVTGTARDAGDKLVGSGESQGFNPAVVAPGEIAWGYVYFDTELAGQTLKYTFEIEAETLAEAMLPSIPVTVTEINNTPSQILGTATNESGEAVSGPIGADIICFDAAGAFTDQVSGYFEQDELEAGATGSFSIDLYDESCANGLVAASGFSF